MKVKRRSPKPKSQGLFHKPVSAYPAPPDTDCFVESRSVALADLIPTSSGQDVAKISRIAATWNDSKAYICVAQLEGHLYIHEGHHTVAAALKLGKQRMQVDVMYWQ